MTRDKIRNRHLNMQARHIQKTDCQTPREHTIRTIPMSLYFEYALMKQREEKNNSTEGDNK